SHPLLSAWKNDVYVLWQDLSSGNYSILLKKSTDNGTTFGPVVKVTGITGNAEDLQLATSADNLYVLWKDAGSAGIMLKKSTNGGVGFGPATKLSTSTLPGANIATLGTNVYVVWKDIISGNYNIVFKRSTDNGATFGPAIKISKEGFDPHISVSTNSVYVIWQDGNSQGIGGILITRSTDNGATFGPAIKISKNSTTAISNLNIATLGTNVYVVWKASSMILKRSTDNGATFGPAVDLSKYYDGLANFDGIMDLQLVISQENNNIYLGWNQPVLSPYDYSSSLHSDVFFARVQPAVFVQSSLYYNEQLVAPARKTIATGPGEQLLSVVRPQPQVEEGVWFYANYWKGPLTNLIVDELVKRKINTIYFSAPDKGGWDNSSKVLNYVDFINYARAKGMRVLGVTLEDPSFVFSTEPELKKTFGDFIKRTENIFDGYVIDVEPQAVPGADMHVYLPRYISMSKILRNVADGYHKEFIDSVPAWYHTVLKQIGISIGINALSSNRINLIDYTYPTTEAILNNINDVRSEISTPYIVNLMITPGHGAPQLSGQEIPRTIITLKSNLLPIAFDEAQYLLNLDSGLFP
ncbi:MAG: glycoside hydrolase, partial [Thermoproteota archaeon]|nr:glycoside hydrolase [Thermoproteota archaeon]